ncbi:MAG: hypothetical protein Q9216_006058 [Gyalolechia sp. 2 TL-2023]
MPFHSRQLPEPPHQQSPHPTPDGMNPSSALLQDLLREKKAAQHARRMSESEQSNYERQVQSSPLAPSMASHSAAGNRRSSAYAAPKEMGLREMEEYISKISKQNFDLKLEVFHRRQRNEVLEAKVVKAAEVESQNEELRQINDDLLQELEKRDVAVQEAVTLICDLEARIDQLEKEQSSNRESPLTPANATDHMNAQNTKPPEPPTTPLPRHGSPRATSSTPSSKRRYTPDAGRTYKERQDDLLVRSPSFLRDANPSTSVLRGLFVNQEGLTAKGARLNKPSTRSLRRTGSFWSQDEDPESLDGDAFALDPRRLSLLSESSFISVYGQNKEKITPSTAHADDTKLSPTQEQEIAFTRKLSPQEGRIRSWIDSKDHPSGSSKRAVKGIKPDTFSSIGTVLGSDQPKPRDTLASVSPTPSRRQRQDVSPLPFGKTSQKPSFAGPIFGPDVLPPTPGTMSTATLGGRSSNQSIADERSLNGGQSRPSSSARSALPETRPYGPKGGRTTAQNRPQHAMDDTNADTRISDNERQDPKAAANANSSYQSDIQFSGFSQASPFTSGSSQMNRSSSIRTSQRPPSMAPSKDFMFNGDGIDSIRPARTISHPSPSGSHHSSTKTPSRSTAQAPASGNAQAKNSGKEPSIPPAAAEPFVEPSIRRSLSTRSKSSHSTAQVLPTQRLTDRLFRRSTSHPASPEAPSTDQPAPVRSPETVIRQPRPSSLYVRSNSTQSPSPSSSAAAVKVTRATRPGTANNPGAPDPSALRRHSVALKPVDDNDVVPKGGLSGQQQQNKRLSVGAFGRSASLKIKEGLRGKK